MKPTLLFLDHLPHNTAACLDELASSVSAEQLCHTLKHWLLLALSNPRDNPYEIPERRTALPLFCKRMCKLIRALYQLHLKKENPPTGGREQAVIDSFMRCYGYRHCRAELYQLAEAVITYEGRLPNRRTDFFLWLQAYLALVKLVFTTDNWMKIAEGRV